MPRNNHQTERAHIRTQPVFKKKVMGKCFESNIIFTNFHHDRARETWESFISVGLRVKNRKQGNSLLCLVEEVCRIRSESFEKLVDRSALDNSIHLLVSHIQRLMQQLPVLSPSFAIWLHPVGGDLKVAGPVKEQLAYTVVNPHPILSMR